MDFLQSVLNSAEGLDVSILLFIQEHLRFEALSVFFRYFTHLGDSGVLWLALSIALLFPKRTRRAGALSLVCMCLGAVLVEVLLKPQVARIRPYEAYEAIWPLIGPQSGYSFPSGHTSSAFCSAFIYLKTLRRPYGALLVVLASLLAFSRLYVGVHYPTDVLGGILVAALVSSVLLILFGTSSYGEGREKKGKTFKRRGR